jgi:hypothetical protein
MPYEIDTAPKPLRALGVRETSALIGRCPDTVRKLFRTGAIKTSIFCGRRFTTLAEIQRAMGVDAEGRIAYPANPGGGGRTADDAEAQLTTP